MIKVQEFTRKREEINGDVGIEIEVEAKSPVLVESDVWSTKDEGSLRGGKEYVTKYPIFCDTLLKDRIEYVTKRVDTPKAKVDYKSDRTSVHIHKNVTKFTTSQVWAICTAYWLLENVLFKYCGDSRESNSFCLRLKDAEGLMKQALLDFSYEKPFGSLRAELLKYAGLNIATIYRLGSLEFRGMKGSVDPQEIYNWTIGINHLCEKTRLQFSNPEEIMDWYFKNGPTKLIDLLLFNPIKNEINKIKKVNDLVEENAFRLIDLAYGRDWNAYEAKLEGVMKKKKTPKKPAFQQPLWVADPDVYTNAYVLD